jgi:thiol-disulfide isomerase/thioredoxin
MKIPAFVLCLTPCLLHSQEVKLDWMPKGFFGITRYYKPKAAVLSEVKPDHISKLPEALVKPQFASIEIGPKDARMKVGIVIEQRGLKEARMWLDANGDGDLTNDPAVDWKPHVMKSGAGEKVGWGGEAAVSVKHGDTTLSMGLRFYRNGSADGTSSKPGPLTYYRDFGRSGFIQLNGRAIKTYLSDDTTLGDFLAGGTNIGIDLNGDNRIEMQTEKFAITAPFNIGGTTYEVSGLTSDGSRFELVKSDKTVPEVKLAQPFTPEMKEQQKSAAAVRVAEARSAQAAMVGKPPPSFEAKTIDGKVVKFPGDYKGKLVMLDFWATWCGPCLHELPGLIKVHEEFHAKGFEVLGISLDSEDDVATLPDFIKSKGMSWPQICDGQGWQCTIARSYGVRGIPSCWLIDGDTGLVVATSQELRGAALRGTVERCLANLGKAATAEVESSSPQPPDPVALRVQSLAAEGRLTPAEKITQELKSPKAARIELPAASTAPIRGREIAKRAAAAHVRVGWVYQCTKCDRWHSNLAGGYAIASDVVATARHVVEPPSTMRPGSGHAVVVRGSDEVLNVTSVILADEVSDTAILRVSAKDLKPLAFSRDVQVGDTAYCLSDPKGVIGHFSAGIVNRLFSVAKAGEKADPLQERIAVSADWAPGSSGSAILDEYGNIIGHVARIRPLLGKPGAPDSQSKEQTTIPTLMTVNEAVPALVIVSSIEKLGEK